MRGRESKVWNSEEEVVLGKMGGRSYIEARWGIMQPDVTDSFGSFLSFCTVPTEVCILGRQTVGQRAMFGKTASNPFQNVEQSRYRSMEGG